MKKVFSVFLIRKSGEFALHSHHDDESSAEALIQTKKSGHYTIIPSWVPNDEPHA